jgi:hypothetical protein
LVLAGTAFLFVAAATPVEFALGMGGAAAAATGPVGVALDAVIVVHAEILLVDSEVSYVSYAYRTISTGKRQEMIWTPPWGLN